MGRAALPRKLSPSPSELSQTLYANCWLGKPRIVGKCGQAVCRMEGKSVQDLSPPVHGLSTRSRVARYPHGEVRQECFDLALGLVIVINNSDGSRIHAGLDSVL
jgi:hypothetical protein